MPIWDSFFVFVAAAAAATRIPHQRGGQQTRASATVQIPNILVTQPMSSAVCVRTCVFVRCNTASGRTAPVTPTAAGVGERVDDFVVIRRGAYSLGHDKTIPKYC